MAVEQAAQVFENETTTGNYSSTMNDTRVNSLLYYPSINMEDLDFFLTVESITLPVTKLQTALGLVGNFFAFLVLNRKTFKYSSTGVYLRALAVFDFLVMLWFLVFDLFSLYFTSSKWLCFLVDYGIIVCINLSNWSLVLITVERLCAILIPHKVKRIMTEKTAYISLTCLVILFLLIDANDLYFFEDAGWENCVMTYNTEPARTYNKVIIYIHLFKFLLVPFPLICIGNVIIIVYLHKQTKLMKTNDSKDTKASSGTIQNRGCEQNTANTINIDNGHQEQFNKTPALGNGCKEEDNKTPALGNGCQKEDNKTPALGNGCQEEVNKTPALGNGRQEEVNKTPALGNGRQEEDNKTPALCNGCQEEVSKTPALGNGCQEEVNKTPALGRQEEVSKTPALGNGCQEEVSKTPALGNGCQKEVTKTSALGNGRQEEVKTLPKHQPVMAVAMAQWPRRVRKTHMLRSSREQRDRSLTVTLLTLNFCFLITRLPHEIHNMSLGIPPPESLTLRQVSYQYIVGCISAVNNVLNVFLYLATGSRFRKESKAMLIRMFRCCR